MEARWPQPVLPFHTSVCGHDESDAYRRAKAVYPPPGDINELASLSVYEFRRYVSEMHVRLVTFLRIEDLSTIGPCADTTIDGRFEHALRHCGDAHGHPADPYAGAGRRPRAP